MKIIVNAFKVIFVLLTIANTFAIVMIFRDFAEVKSSLVDLSQKTSRLPSSFFPVEAEQVDLSAYATKQYVDESVSEIPVGGSTEKVTVVKETVSDSSPKTSIIPINSNFESQSLVWIDVPNSDFYLDLASDYSEGAEVTWDAFLHELHGNGLAEARIMDITHGIVVVNSEISTNNSTSTLVSSGNLAIWKGKNLYRVQVKSQKGFPVYFNSGRLKIRY